MLVSTLTRVVELRDWDAFVREIYGKPYKFQQQDGGQDRGTVYFSLPLNEDELEDSRESAYSASEFPEVPNGEFRCVAFEDWLQRDPTTPLNPTEKERTNFERHLCAPVRPWCADESYIKLYWERNFYPPFEVLVDDLHKKGLLPDGEYAIVIDW